MLKILICFIIFGFSTFLSAKTILNQIKDDQLKVAIDYSAIIDAKYAFEDVCKANYQPTKVNHEGTPIKMLGYAAVYMGSGPGISRYGHAGERFVYCIGEELFDVYYDGVKLTKEVLSDFQIIYPEIDPVYLNSEKVIGAIYYRKILNPTQNLEYGLDTIRANRNIYEQWLKLTENEILSLLQNNIQRINDQDKKVEQKIKLPRFRGILNNCTDEVVSNLQSLERFAAIKIGTNNQIEPFNEISLKDKLNTFEPKEIYLGLSESSMVDYLVIYPSIDNVRKVLLNEVSQKELYKILEIPHFKLNPKFASNWTDFEIKQINNKLINYKSPLLNYFENRIKSEDDNR